MRSSRFAKSGLGIPYALFLLLFVVAPLFVLLYYAFTNGQGQFTVQNLAAFFTSPNTIGTLAYSFALAVVTTCVCVLLAYPIAYILARSNMRHKSVILVAFVMPMWINFTLRITALKEILTVLEGNLALHPFLNSVIGMTYDFLPFMILPMYTTLMKLDTSLIEAAGDLGANPVQTFLKVDMLYNSTYIMGSLIGSYFASYDWHNGSMIALILLLIILIFTLFTNKYSDEDEGRGGALI